MKHYWVVCESCGHIETLAKNDDRPFKCENCRHRQACPFETQEWAIDYSEEVLDRNDAYRRTLRGEMAGGW